MAYWPASRPSFTTGTEAAYVRTTAIWSSTRSLLRTLSAVAPANVSAQSPPWSRNALPCATSAELDLEVVALTGEDQRRQRAEARDGGVDARRGPGTPAAARARARAATPGRGWRTRPGYGARPGARPSPTSSGTSDGEAECRGEAVARREQIETCRRRRLRRTGEPARRGGAAPRTREPQRGARLGARRRRERRTTSRCTRARATRRSCRWRWATRPPAWSAAVGDATTSGWSAGDEVIAFRASGAYASDLVVDAHALTRQAAVAGLARGGRD